MIKLYHLKKTFVAFVLAKMGSYKQKGKYIANPKYDSMSSYSEGYAAIKKDDKWGYIDTKGKEVIKTKYVDAYSFINGKAVVEDSKISWV